MPLNLYTGMKVDGVRIKSVDNERLDDTFLNMLVALHVTSSIAEKAGLKPGMILQEIEDNPVALNSSGDKIQQILEAARNLALQKDTELLRIKVYDTRWEGINHAQPTFTARWQITATLFFLFMRFF